MASKYGSLHLKFVISSVPVIVDVDVVADDKIVGGVVSVK